ncbi:PHP domain-containing protein [Planosporangium thailandense]|uniref:PHP domain-containing protein n=1 Tax=Planosporangium thailandense TaxID=765197 RepID=A0ABX0XXT6_9ACTN|nr:PHP domain-containing protein [Planosporangium thailandense]
MTIVLTRPVATVPSTVDLHLHSTVSDGDDSPGELARRCVDAGLRVVACTDHDSLAGYDEFRAAAAPAGLTVVPGCEITATWRGQEVHCLAYFVDPADATFQARVTSVRDEETRWWRTWFAQASAARVPVSWAAVERRFGPDRVAYLGDYLDFFLAAAGDDPRFAGYERGGRHDRLIAEWCRPGQPLHVPPPWRPPLSDVVAWVRAASGVAVLAHPGRLGAESDPGWAELAELGLAGLEAWTTWHDPADIRRTVDACEAVGLIPTAGSDYHGPRLKPWAPAPGLLPEAVPEPLAAVEALYHRRD